MRTEKEIYELALGFAQAHSRIRAVSLAGSRANPNATKDRFQDYDITFFVTEIDSFKVDDAWLDVFGDRIIMQKPEAMTLFPPDFDGWFTYLMLFTDGNRIDLSLIPITDIDKYLDMEKGMVKVLLDKDGLFPELSPPTDKAHHVHKPSINEFSDCCNQFWWITTYVSKGLARKEFLYAADHLNIYARPELLRMLSWKAGIKTDFSVSIGKNYKYLEQYVERDLWRQLLATFSMSGYEKCWDTLFLTIRLFEEAAKQVAVSLQYVYPESEYRKVGEYVKSVYLVVSS